MQAGACGIFDSGGGMRPVLVRQHTAIDEALDFMRKLRVGIDVGGTFTHAVAVDNETLAVAAHQVVPTTHRSSMGVAEGIIQAFKGLRGKLASDDEIVFLAHSTTQATNALLEGDVAKVGIAALAGGLEAVKVKSDVNVGRIELAEGKFLETLCTVVDPGAENFADVLRKELTKLKEQGAEAVVAAQGFSVDDPSGELAVQKACTELELPSCATHEMSGLYGLSVRTQTAVLNAGILPKMIGTALMTKQALDDQKVTAPLMVMRSDGGVMSLDEVRRRPVLTLLSGPAAGIAACLMFLKASDALFLEVGGTSTDICLVKDGRAAVRSASIGGRSTYLRTLDSRTLGIAGGSMIGWNGTLQAGPRSAHLAGFAYCAFAGNDPKWQISDLKITEESPFAGDHPYAVVNTPDGRKLALTATCAANLLGLVPEGGYSQGDRTFTGKAFAALAGYFAGKGWKPDTAAYRKWQAGRSDAAGRGQDGSEDEALLQGYVLAYEMLRRAADIVTPVLRRLMEDYKMEGRQLKLIGGGGGAAAIVPFTAQVMGLPFEIADHAEVISAVGAALAMVRESIERNIVNPSQADLQALRAAAEQAVIKMGADPESVEVTIEVDAQKNMVRAVALGAVAMSNRAASAAEVSEEERLATLKKSAVSDALYELLGTTGIYYIYRGTVEKKVFFGLFKKKISTIWVTDRFGSVRLQVPGASCEAGTAGNLSTGLDKVLNEHTSYGDAGAILPSLHIAAGHKICDLSSLAKAEQISDLARSELADLPPEAPLFFIISDN